MNNFFIKYLKYKKKYLSLTNQYGGDILDDIFCNKDYKIIGEGYKVLVYTKNDIDNRIFKTYGDKNVFHLALKQIEVQTFIQDNLDENDFFLYVKIPKIISIDINDNYITIEFERIYNIEDTDINVSSSMLNVILTNNEIKPRPIAGRGSILTLNDIEEKIGKIKLKEYLYELGKLFAILNYKIGIIINDIEIVFGKNSITDINYKFFILDFDRCRIIDLKNETIKKLINDGKYVFNILKLREYIDINKFNYIKDFKDGYINTGLTFNIKEEVLKEVFEYI